MFVQTAVSSARSPRHATMPTVSTEFPFMIDGQPVSQSQPTAVLHLAAAVDDPTRMLCAKIYLLDDTSTSKNKAAAEREQKYGELIVSTRPDCNTIVQYVKVGSLVDGRPYIIMPFYFVSVANLLTWFTARSHRHLATSALARVALGLASALHVLHGLGLAHCDVKPENVMLRADGVPVLVDLAAVTPFGETPFETTSDWILPEPGVASELAARSSASLDLRCLAATVFVAMHGDINQLSNFFSCESSGFSFDGIDDNASAICRCCWEGHTGSASELVTELSKLIRGAGLLTDADIATCLSVSPL